MTKILYCVCQHLVQDMWYGANKRVHNEMKKTALGTKYRCTVCGQMKAE